jgi:hypothetical protein
MLPKWLLNLFGGKVVVAHTWVLPSFYDHTAMDKDSILSRLKTASTEAIKDFQPKTNKENEIIETYCNVATDYICREVWKFKGFMNMMANQIFDRMKNAPDFAEVTPDTAQTLANDGRMVIAGFKNEPHGHCAVVVPGKALYSGKWMKNAPLIANVGKRNGIMGANFAFRTPPIFFAHISDESKETNA